MARDARSAARGRADHRLLVVRLGGRGAGHRRPRLHREADPRPREPALPHPPRAVPPGRADVARRRAAPNVAGARVLLVEVEGARRQLMAEFLGRTYQVIAVADGNEALRRLQDERFDVVLADRNLPGLSGLRVIEQAQPLASPLRVRALHRLSVVRHRQGGVRAGRGCLLRASQRGPEEPRPRKLPVRFAAAAASFSVDGDVPTLG